MAYRTLSAAAMILATASIANSAPRKAAQPDVRLVRPVTCNAIGTDLGRVASLITGETGVRIRVAKDISDEKLDVFVEDYPLGKLQRNIAALFGYRWAISPGTEANPVYLLWRDANTRARQERLRALKKEHTEKRLHDDVDNIKRVLDMKDEDVQKLTGDERAFADYARGEPGLRLLSGLAGSNPDAIFGDGYQGNPAALSADDAKQLQGALKGFGGVFAGKSVQDFPQFAVELPGHNQQTNMDTGGNLFSISVKQGGDDEGHFFALTPEALKRRAERPDEGLLNEYMRGFRPRDGKPDLSDPRLDKPMKQAKVRLVKYGTRTWTEDTEDFNAGLQRIAVSTGVPILSDYYTIQLANQSLTGLTARAAVKRLYETFGRTCVAKDGALLFRNNDWPNLMPGEIPNRFVDALTAAATQDKAQNAALNFNQSLIASALTDEQLKNLGSIGWYALWSSSDEQKAILRFTNLLTSLQRGQLEGPQGLDLSVLPDTLAQAFGEFYTARWTAGGFAPRVLSVRLQRNFHPPTEPQEQPYAAFTFSIAGGGDTKESTLFIRVAPDKTAPRSEG